MFDNIRKDDYLFLLNGKWISSKSGKTIQVNAPADGRPLGKIQAITPEEADLAVRGCTDAQQAWMDLPVNERAEILHKAADILEENSELFVNLLMAEVAKSRSQAKDEVHRTVIFIDETAEEGKRIRGILETGDGHKGGKRDKLAMVERWPYGVVLAISPFNYPVNLAASKLAPALVAGNTVIFKPATQGAICGLHLAEVFQKAGLPPGVLNVVTGRGGDIGDFLTSHPLVNCINFTGSTAVGHQLALKAAAVPLLLEMGGKDAALVLEDADLEAAAKDIVAGAFQFSGQRCTGIKRVFPMPAVAEELIRLVKKEAEKLVVGMPEADANVTPIISEENAVFVQGMIDEAIKQGAKLVMGNKRVKNLMNPTILDNVTREMRIAWVEPFAPVLPIIRVKDEAEAIKLNNDSEYGLEACVFTKSITKACSIARQLKVGVVQINGKSARGPDNFPFTGIKHSGLGSQGIRYGIEAMTYLKTTVINLK